MFDHWLLPAKNTPAPTTNYSWASHIDVYQNGATLLPKQCVLIGLDTVVADALREELYPMSWAFPGLKFTDLGNLRKTGEDFVIPLLKEVMDSQLFPILIGGNPSLLYAQFQAFLSLRDHVNLAVIDERVPVSQEKKKTGEKYLNRIVHQRRENLFHLSLIGPQAHFTNPAIIDWFDEQQFEYLRLGQARENFAEVEPLLRDADIIALHLDALKRAEAPGQLNPSPSGFFLEEACQLCRYAGMSDKLRSFGIYGIDGTVKRKLKATAEAVAQMVWYFTEGYYQRLGDYPVSNKGLTEYIVGGKGEYQQLTFWKSVQSGRWWLQVPVETGHQHQRHRLIPCSYNDYKLATQQELPDRLWNAFRRF
ncbi:MAG: arginase [Bacteroidetes bacterium]|nr:MAG: arginase [Bacteroidota bacterium]PTM15133.1 MAG: arginase [Bacteroidota bacterium]